MRQLIVGLALLLVGSAAIAQDNCAYLPAFKTLRAKLPTLSATRAVAALTHYTINHEEAEACELFEIDRLLNERERSLFKLRIDTKDVPAQVVFRCNEFESATASCRGPMEDLTSHPFTLGIVPLAAPDAEVNLMVKSTLPGTQLQNIYWVTLAGAEDGKAAEKLGAGPTVRWQAAKNSALIAIYKTTGPWAYRKAVWYF